jgi:hypothetical protein
MDQLSRLYLLGKRVIGRIQEPLTNDRICIPVFYNVKSVNALAESIEHGRRRAYLIADAAAQTQRAKPYQNPDLDKILAQGEKLHVRLLSQVED